MIEIRKIIGHRNPDLDTFGFIWIVRKFGEKEFTGINNAPVEFLPGGVSMPDGRTGDEWLKDGVLVGDMGGGQNDHHQFHPEDNRKNQRCATTLIADFLGLRNDLALEPIIRSIAKNDLFGGSYPLDLAKLIKDSNSIGKDPLETMKLIFSWLDIAYEAQKLFVEAVEDSKSEVEICKLPMSNKSKIMIATTNTDNPQKLKALRFKLKVDVIARLAKTGNVQIFNRVEKNQATVTLKEVIKIIRFEEQKKAGKITVPFGNELEKEGTILGPGIDIWHYLRSPKNHSEMILNGSFTVEKPPTKLTREEILRAILIGLDKEYFAPECPKVECPNCSFYPYVLKRCRDLRLKKTKITSTSPLFLFAKICYYNLTYPVEKCRSSL